MSHIVIWCPSGLLNVLQQHQRKRDVPFARSTKLRKCLAVACIWSPDASPSTQMVINEPEPQNRASTHSAGQGAAGCRRQRALAVHAAGFESKSVQDVRLLDYSREDRAMKCKTRMGFKCKSSWREMRNVLQLRVLVKIWRTSPNLRLWRMC